MVDECAHVIIHLEHANEQQDFELVETAAVIASLEQQVQVLQLLVPPAPATPAVESLTPCQTSMRLRLG
jgi:hypothetical protein